MLLYFSVSKTKHYFPNLNFLLSSNTGCIATGTGRGHNYESNLLGYHQYVQGELAYALCVLVLKKSGRIITFSIETL